ncbi:GTP-binding protein [Paenibacillus radicis (ex Xue et al. 2023)]|uniref:sulfate adenylyltransferase n=1 Tax=Paenibacillus radicis (ex Xue et al. 2023) TaxID=2972489 RepID=A0ABT1YTU4_9BACL|nr:GTP-binding protein [Paenibacillus radicis (ex Xue et al. 2023)]MCR8636611.1 GTP-binding protein [Paenibacillus radicis (ex Xue et al. 2023)]
MKSLLKFITCGSVDDGKSTLIGHMLYEAKLLFADQERALELDSRLGSRGGKIDYSLLLDGLLAEREQGITIDVAYRYFTTDHRSFIVADTPGHVEYTRNMAVGASFADLAIILADATKGVITQTKRHTRICALMGIKHLVLAVNKMDLVNFDPKKFEAIKQEFSQLTTEFHFESIQVIPVSATEGDNITKKSPNTPWYDGLALLPYLENVDVHQTDDTKKFMMPIQRVCRPDHTFRGFQGQIEAGTIAVGEELTTLPSREKAKVKRILVTDQDRNSAHAGQPVTIQLDREVDVSRGCVFTKDNQLQEADSFSATILWMDDSVLMPGKNYLVKVGTKVLPGTVTAIIHKIDINSGNTVPADHIVKNELAKCEFSLSDNIVFDSFEKNKSIGGFILIDRVTNMTSACGVINQTLQSSDSLVRLDTEITRDVRAQQKGQNPLTLWFIGTVWDNSTLAKEVEKRLVSTGHHTMLLNNGQGESLQRLAEVAKLMNDAGLIALVSNDSPVENDRETARDIIGKEYIEVYVNGPLAGSSSTKDTPGNPEIEIDTSNFSIEEAANYVVKRIIKYLINESSRGQFLNF